MKNLVLILCLFLSGKLFAQEYILDPINNGMMDSLALHYALISGKMDIADSNSPTGYITQKYLQDYYYTQTVLDGLFNTKFDKTGGTISGPVTLSGAQINGLGSFGDLLYYSNTGWGSNSRRYLVTNRYEGDSYAIIRSVDNSTTPMLDASGNVASGLVDFSIRNDGLVSVGSGGLNVGGSLNTKLLQFYGIDATFKTNYGTSTIYRSYSGGSYPFDNADNLIIQSRSDSPRDVIIAGGTTPGIIAVFKGADKSSNFYGPGMFNGIVKTTGAGLAVEYNGAGGYLKLERTDGFPSIFTISNAGNSVNFDYDGTDFLFKNDLSITKSNNPSLRLYETGTSGNNQAIGVWEMYGKNSAQENVNYSSITYTALTYTDGLEDGKIDIYNMKAGALTNALTLNKTDATFYGDVSTLGAYFLFDSGGGLEKTVYIDTTTDNIHIKAATGNYAGGKVYIDNTVGIPQFTFSTSTGSFEATGGGVFGDGLSLDDGLGSSGDIFIGFNGRAWAGYQSNIFKLTTTKTIGLYTGASQALAMSVDVSQNTTFEGNATVNGNIEAVGVQSYLKAYYHFFAGTSGGGYPYVGYNVKPNVVDGTFTPTVTDRASVAKFVSGGVLLQGSSTQQTAGVDFSLSNLAYFTESLNTSYVPFAIGENGGLSGSVTWVASDNNQGTAAINASDQLLISDFTGGVLINSKLNMQNQQIISVNEFYGSTNAVIKPDYNGGSGYINLSVRNSGNTAWIDGLKIVQGGDATFAGDLTVGTNNVTASKFIMNTGGYYLQGGSTSVAIKNSGGTTLGTYDNNYFYINPSIIPTYADDTAAGTGGLTAGEFYKTSSGVVMVKL